MATAPFCNVEVALPPGKPASPKGFVTIPPNVTQSQMITMINNNFNQLIKGNYVENRNARQTQIVRIFDPQNSGSFVDVRQIVAVQFVNTTTGQVINWGR